MKKLMLFIIFLCGSIFAQKYPFVESPSNTPLSVEQYAHPELYDLPPQGSPLNDGHYGPDWMEKLWDAGNKANHGAGWNVSINSNKFYVLVGCNISAYTCLVKEPIVNSACQCADGVMKPWGAPQYFGFWQFQWYLYTGPATFGGENNVIISDTWVGQFIRYGYRIVGDEPSCTPHRPPYC